MTKMKDSDKTESKYARKGFKTLYSSAYTAWRNNPNTFTAANHRKYVEQQFGPLAKSRPVSYREEEINHEYLEAHREAAE